MSYFDECVHGRAISEEKEKRVNMCVQQKNKHIYKYKEKDTHKLCSKVRLHFSQHLVQSREPIIPDAKTRAVVSSHKNVPRTKSLFATGFFLFQYEFNENCLEKKNHNIS